jgi:hypothetical protein
MKKQTAKSGASEATKAHVAFGLDEHGKPRAARFVGASPALLAKAAQAMQLQLVEIQTEAEGAAASKLPTGRLYSTGRGFVPNVRRELYARLLEALGSKAGSGAAVATAENVYPSSYDELAAGHLVLVQADKLEWGWWEAVVVARQNETVTVKWRDYKAPEFVRHFDAVALIRAPAPRGPTTESSAP